MDDTALSALKAYQAAVQSSAKRQAHAVTDGGGASLVAGSPFKSMVQDEVHGVASQLKSAERMAAAGTVGQAPLIDVVTSIASAELSLETMIAVRDQVVAAYQEIMRMPV